MSEPLKTMRLSKAAVEFNVSINTIIDFLKRKGHTVDPNPNTKLTEEQFALLAKEYQSEKMVKEEAKKIVIENVHHSVSLKDKEQERTVDKEKEEKEVLIKNTSIGFSSDHKTKEPEPKPAPKTEPAVPAQQEKQAVETPEKKEEIQEKPAKPKAEETETLSLTGKVAGIKVVDKIDVDAIEKKSKTDKKGKSKKSDKEITEEQDSEIKAETPAVIVDPEPAVETVSEVEAVVTEEAAQALEEVPRETEPQTKDPNFIKTKYIEVEGVKLVGKIDLPIEKQKTDKKTHEKVGTSSDEDLTDKGRKKKRKRIKKEAVPLDNHELTQKEKPRLKLKDKDKKQRKEYIKPEVSGEEIEKQIKETLAKLGPLGKSKSSKYRRLKRESVSQQIQEELQKQEQEKKILKVSEFVTVNELATMINVPVNELISLCISLGLFVSINQRLDAENMVLLAEEFGYQVSFISVDEQQEILEKEPDRPEDIKPRHPIVTVMGHVDHGKTKLLDYIRNTNVMEGEAGGITQHIGAYEVQLDDGKKITFLDTPGHEAFTAMRARGAKVTDLAIIVIAADDHVMPQTVEAINHAQAAGVPIVFAINKVDKPTANPEKIKEELSQMNILVEDWGGKYQCQEISAKEGLNVGLLLEKVLLEAEILDLKANPDKLASGTVIESSLDKGRGYVAKLLVQNGTMKVGDIIVAGTCHGKVKAMFNQRNQAVKTAGPSTPILLLGLNGAPQAGDTFNVMKDEKEAKAIANKRQQILREQGLRTHKHITLDEIGRRIAIGDFKELNIIVKGDVDGSIEALSDSMLKLSTPEVQVNVIHKSVGAITESDVLLASASNAIIVGFQVRPSMSARKLAEQEQIDIRLYSIIYTAIEELKSAIEGMLSPEIEEKILCNLEIREVFKISKVGSVAGCMVLDGKISRQTKVRVIRDGIVVYTGMLGSLKRFKDDVKEVSTGYECGLNIDNYNDIKVGDIIEGYEEVEIKRKL